MSWTAENFIPANERIFTALETRLKTASTEQRIIPPIAEFTQFYDPRVGGYPKLTLVCHDETPGESGHEQKIVADCTARVYVQQSDPRYGQSAAKRTAWQIVMELHRWGNVAGSGRFCLKNIKYGAQADEEGKPVFRADINFELRYSEAWTEG